jgi:hypothetical protein
MTQAAREQAWPPLPYEAWRPTKETLHRFAQMVGKLRMSLVPFRNHWWHVTLYPSAHGLTTGAMPADDGATVEVEFDFVDHRLHVRTSDGRAAGFALRDGLSAGQFHGELSGALRDVGVGARVSTQPYDLGDTPAFPDDTIHRDYDADAVERFWRVVRRTDEVLGAFASDFTGKASPTQLFWHSFDLAHSRYSGRRAPPMPGADRVTAEAYSHDVIAFGWWPGDERTTPYPAYYSYTAPEPERLADQPLQPAAAAWQAVGNGSLAVLPYDAVRAAPDPAATLRSFYDSAYEAGTATAGWDAEALAHTPVATQSDGG